ncbi:trypsin-like peptidase domain-containing protein [Pseudanabaena sp. FACHB-2040]|uniref:VMAP-C domain-containing protein n=1 Tax=Pseudanabaena sp. FACHB-2040 TaxID=2692859 RepID=UPI0016885342|nr:trypsin-like peptidase domain-containing protein [Pseudanabaena sp. FACHB-2040]MBD2261110.1 trypsin-like peptidase domain-containing protein [Pseudanabaena sp. FACHB-2040]
MGFEESKQALTQIHFAGSDAIAGTGFLVADSYVLTCAHVVKAALPAVEEPIGASIEVTFPFLGPASIQAAVVFCEFDEFDGGRDAAVLHLLAPSQLAHQPMPLVPLLQFDSAVVKAFGFPNGEPLGRNLIAVTRGEVTGGWIQIEDTKGPGLAVEAGFSGAPVWCDASQAAVGMVVARDQDRPEAKIGFILPTQKLQTPLQEIQKHSLAQLLTAHQQALTEQIATAYKICRPDNWSAPFPVGLEEMLADLSQMHAESLSASRLVQFGACLLNQAETAIIRAELTGWLEKYAEAVAPLLKQMEQRQQQMLPATTPSSPCLLVNVQADKTSKAEPYQINAWLIANINRYDPRTGEGADVLPTEGWQEYVDDPSQIDPQAGIKYEDIPAMIASYLDQVGRRGIDLQNLTVEFFLPFSLINRDVEQCCIPAEFGFPKPLGIDEDCCHVVLRSQERLEFARGLAAWQSKWKQLDDNGQQKAMNLFIRDETASPKQLQKALQTAFGLKLTRLPKATNQGEIGLLLATGTPAAIWIRSSAEHSWEELVDTQVLSGSLGQVPNQVLALRRNTLELDEEDDLEMSLELGHHLSFLWEDPHRRPPEITYSDKNL